MAERGRVLQVLTAGVVTLMTAAGMPSATARAGRPAPIGGDAFTPGQPYRGDFPDPTVWRVGRRFYAASTTVASLSLPVISSTDLRTWVARPALDPGTPGMDDAMPRPAPWTMTRLSASGRPWIGLWAPSVVRLRTGTFVAAYSAPRSLDGRRCISLASSTSPTGPFVDSRRAPISCGNHGVLDPQIFLDRGAIYMTYKMKSTRDTILVRRMNNHATGFALGSRNYALLTPRAAWEGRVVENPALIRVRNRVYLFYAGNDYYSTRYATGYAICRTVTGPCKRQQRLLATGRYVAGPGGAEPFLDLHGRLRLAYHAWTVGNVGYPRSDSCRGTAKGCAQRRLHVAVLAVGRRGRLSVRSW